MATVYSINNWDRHFELSQSRKVDGPLNWVKVPTKHDGLGFRRIMAMSNGAAIYGTWVLMVQVAAKCPVRGVLADETGPLDAGDLSAKTGCPESLFFEALKVLSSNKIAWLVGAEWEPSGSRVFLEESRGEEKREEKNAPIGAFAELSPKAKPAATASTLSVSPSEFVFPTTGKGPAEWALPQAKLAEYLAAYPALDVSAELRKARQWCRDHVRQRKTAGGMLGFLTRWLNRAQNNPRDSRILPVEKQPRKTLVDVASAVGVFNDGK